MFPLACDLPSAIKMAHITAHHITEILLVMTALFSLRFPPPVCFQPTPTHPRCLGFVWSQMLSLRKQVSIKTSWSDFSWFHGKISIKPLKKESLLWQQQLLHEVVTDSKWYCMQQWNLCWKITTFQINQKSSHKRATLFSNKHHFISVPWPVGLLRGDEEQFNNKPLPVYVQTCTVT